MKYIIMCGGVYQEFCIPKPCQIIKGEMLVQRTIRLLHEAGVEQVYISATDERYDKFDAIRLVHHNDFEVDDKGNCVR